MKHDEIAYVLLFIVFLFLYWIMFLKGFSNDKQFTGHPAAKIASKL